ncbi:hypothetical protein GALMADRAFT_139797 [Galerina marginata CBS 339.88]|uniref:Uncharacterized protein n=1 Tax=Galerina marginata (strain CBS 339.88) TaxID=685588 RepID=A0A067TAN4_GALM3|nr:hypothetical protein GALMADRAFT_139797 [Galerina marginata CBS 339.88]
MSASDMPVHLICSPDAKRQLLQGQFLIFSYSTSSRPHYTTVRQAGAPACSCGGFFPVCIQSGGFPALRSTPNNIPVCSLAVIQVMVWPHVALTLVAEAFSEDQTEGLEERSLHLTMQALAQ